MSQAAIMRNGSPDAPYTIIPNACLQDYSLSLAAHAVLLRILSLPPGWTFYKSWAQKQYGVGRDKMDGIVRELVKAEYCLFERLRNPDGTLGASCFTFTNTKGSFRQDPEKPGVVEKTLPSKAPDHALISPDQAEPAATKDLLPTLENRDEEARERACGALVAQDPKEPGSNRDSGAAAAGEPSALAVDRRAELHAMLKGLGRELKAFGAGSGGPGRRRSSDRDDCSRTQAPPASGTITTLRRTANGTQ